MGDGQSRRKANRGSLYWGWMIKASSKTSQGVIEKKEEIGEILPKSVAFGVHSNIREKAERVGDDCKAACGWTVELLSNLENAGAGAGQSVWMLG